MAAVNLSPIGNTQFVYDDGSPADGSLLWTYIAGSTTPLATYTDSTGLVAQSNPIVLNSLGLPTIGQVFLIDGVAYDIVWEDKPIYPATHGTILKTFEDISGINDTGGSISQWIASGVTPTYISANIFTLPGDQTTNFHVGRREQFTVSAGTVYGTITASAYTSLTTVTMLMDGSDVLDAGLSVVNHSILRADHLAEPFTNVAETIAGVKTFTSSPVVPDATAATQATSFGQLGAAGQCRLSKSGANLLLAPFNGNKLAIDGLNRVIPSAGITLVATGLTPSTLYYIYAYMSSGTMTLEASTTTHATDATTGVEIKSGDATRTLVGMAYPIAGPAFADTPAQRFVLSYFNKRSVSCAGAFTANRSTASATFVELNAEIRNEFLLWGGGIAEIAACGSAAGSVTATVVCSSVGIDSTTAEDVFSKGQAPGNNTLVSMALALNKYGLSEGYHYATVLGLAGGGTATWVGTTTGVGDRTTLSTMIQG